ncbi:MAG: hypothetical protein AB1810_00785 [Pseudomonadota bacterium]
MRVRSVLKFLGAVAGLILVAGIALGFMLSSPAPLVAQKHPIDAASVLRTKELLLSLQRGVLSRGKQRQVTATESDLNGMLAMAERGFPRLAGQARIDVDRADLTLSLHVPENPFGDYVNVQAVIPTSAAGLELESFSIGHLSLPGGFARWLGEWLANLLLGDEQGSAILGSIQRIEIGNQQATVHYQPIPDLMQRLAKFRTRVKTVRDEWQLLGNPAEVKYYFTELCRYGTATAQLPAVSLADYLGIAFTLTGERSLGDEDRIDRNKAAIMALAIYLGSHNFAAFVGNFNRSELAACKTPRNVQLAGREDLRLHFVFSAALKVLADSGASFAMGEFKELLDSNRGGSGFSFIDLAADRAGNRFADLALDSQQGSRRVQELFAARAQEAVFFPDTSGLQENLDQASFERLYSGIESPAYQAVVGEIDRRIDQLVLYDLTVTR